MAGQLESPYSRFHLGQEGQSSRIHTNPAYGHCLDCWDICCPIFRIMELGRREINGGNSPGLGINILILSVWFSIWALLSRNEARAKHIFHPLVCMSIWLSVFVVSLQFAQWFGRWSTPAENQFNFLAYAFLHGKLYLINSPYTGGLTLYKGHWFVPLPPFPAILMMPFIIALGVQAFNTTTFSLTMAATSAVIVYLILHQLIHSVWIKLSQPGAIWLTALFSFGSMYWFLSIDSRLWYFSQVVTVLFSGLAFLSALKKWSPWLTGFFLAAAILCRPTSLLFGPHY